MCFLNPSFPVFCCFFFLSSLCCFFLLYFYENNNQLNKGSLFFLNQLTISCPRNETHPSSQLVVLLLPSCSFRSLFFLSLFFRFLHSPALSFMCLILSFLVLSFPPFSCSILHVSYIVFCFVTSSQKVEFHSK